MTPRSRWGKSPRESVESEAKVRGRDQVVAGCIDLLAGRPADPELIYVLGGPPARWAVTGGVGGPDYWLRVWAARGLLWVWEDAATSAALSALDDEHWRVREMVIKVCARNRVEEALPLLAKRCEDEHPRVRAAAERAMLRFSRRT